MRQIRAVTIGVALLLTPAAAYGQQIITTFAGGGSFDGAALATPIGQPLFIALDSAGNLYISSRSGRIFRVDGSGNLTVVAGGGGTLGDGGAAAGALLFEPYGVALDAAGNLFIADNFNGNRIRKVDAATGIITTIAGDGTAGFSGDGGPAASARVNNPTGLATDSAGNLYIVDQVNLRIRKIDAATGVISTVAGNGTAGFSGDGGLAINASFDLPTTPLGALFPVGIDLDAADNLYIADHNNHRIRKVDGSTGVVTTVAGSGTAGFSGDGGLATGASLDHPCGVAVDSVGNFFISDCFTSVVRRVDAGTGIITTIAGNGIEGYNGDGILATSASLSFFTVAFDSADNLYICDGGNERIRRVAAATSIITTVAGNGTRGFSPGDPRLGEGGPATQAVVGPRDISIDPGGDLFMVEQGNSLVRRVDATTGVITTVAGNSTPGFSGDGGPATAASFNTPSGVAVAPNGDVFVADSLNHRVRRVEAATGTMTTVAGDGTAGFNGDGIPATSASLNSPVDVLLDSAGNLFLTDVGNNRVRRVDAASGVITTVAGDGIFGSTGDGGPATSARVRLAQGSLALDGAGHLAIAQPGSNRVRQVDLTTGIITTVAGAGSGALIWNDQSILAR